jgi:hypothetical protein
LDLKIDIYKKAQEMDADYMDKDGNIYKIRDYNRLLRLGMPTHGIAVFDHNGKFIRIARKN